MREIIENDRPYYELTTSELRGLLLNSRMMAETTTRGNVSELQRNLTLAMANQVDREVAYEIAKRN
jgi:hypothetical protein